MRYWARQLLTATVAAAIAAGTCAAQAQGQAEAEAAMRAGIDAWDKGDFAGAVAHWRPLAEKGDPDAQFNLGQAYKQGKGVREDNKAALSWYQKAAQRGHPQAQVNAGLLLYNEGRKADALPWLRKGADFGDPRAQYILGTELFNGQLLTRDWPRAYALMTLAAGRGLAAAAQNLKAMDQYIPLDQRQQGINLARRIDRGEEKFAGGTQRLAAAGARDAAEAAPPARPERARAPVAAPNPRAPAVQIAGRTPPAPPARATAPKPATPAAGGRWRVQLGAFGDAANAQRQWASLKGKVSAFAGLQPFIVKAGPVTRLQAGPLASRDSADRVCTSAKAAGTSCFPVAP